MDSNTSLQKREPSSARGIHTTYRPTVAGKNITIRLCFADLPVQPAGRVQTLCTIPLEQYQSLSSRGLATSRQDHP